MSRTRSTTIERIHATAIVAASVAQAATLTERLGVFGLYEAICFAPAPHLLDEYVEMAARERALLRADRVDWDTVARLRADIEAIPLEEKWRDRFMNTVVTEGKNAILTHFLKGSSYTASQVLGLIEDTGYSAIAAGNTAGNITAAGGGSPTNGWNEAPSATCAARQTPSFGTASSGSLAASHLHRPSQAPRSAPGPARLPCRVNLNPGAMR